MHLIAERLSARHWIAECGPRLAARVVCIYIYIYIYVCMYVCPSRFWNAIKLLCDVLAENPRTSGNHLPDFDRRYRYIIYASIDVLKKRWWSRKCRKCILKTTMWGRFGTRGYVTVGELRTPAAMWEASTVATNFQWASEEVPWSCKKLCAYNYYKSGLRDRSTRCAFPCTCTHSTCDSNGASLGLSRKIWTPRK